LISSSMRRDAARSVLAARARLRPDLVVILRNRAPHLRELVLQPRQPVRARYHARQPLMFTTQFSQPLGLAMDWPGQASSRSTSGRATERVAQALAQAQTQPSA